MNISLTPELEKIVQRKVATGLYTSASEVIREALRAMIESDRVHEEKLLALRSDIERGIRDIENGDYTEHDTDSTGSILDEITKRRKR